MNCNEFTYNYKPRGRNRNFRGRGIRAVNIQRPVIGRPEKASTKKTASNNPCSSASSIKWKNQSSLSINNVTTTVTHNTSSKTFSTSFADSKIVIAIAAGRGAAACEIGIAALDICKPTLIMCQISDTSSYINTLTKINILNPDEILIPMTLIDSANSNRLINKIKQHFKNVTITAVPRASYNKVTGLQFIKELCAPQWDSIIIVLQHKFYCLTAAAALLTYTESCLFIIYNKRSLKVEYQESEGYCIIDVTTADKLELVNSNSVTPNEKYSSLYGILNYCFTKIGARALRTAILQPSCSVPDIEARLDCVTELKRNSDMMIAVQTILPRISNIDTLLSLATLPSEQGDNFNERHLAYVLTLNVLLDLLEPLKEVFEDSEMPFFKEIRSTLDDESFKKLKHVVRSLIQPDAHPGKGQQAIIEKCFLIKPGVNGLLDVLRRIYSERIEDLREYVARLRDKYNLPLTLSNNSKKSYHITLQLNVHTKKTFKKSELPREFIQVDRLYQSVTMKTMNLINLASRIDDILQEILKMSSLMVYQILVKVRNHIGLFYKLCEDIARLDVIQSLAQASSGNGYIRPQFGDYLEITNSKHPLLDYLCSTEPVANSIFASPNHNVHIITGPNGSGKSVYIRQVLLLQVMAQIGSFIPAETAVVRVCDRMVARVCFDDNMDCGASAFVLEIKEIQYFNTVLTANSLIIIDELCRSTAVTEGAALAMSILETFSKSHVFVYLATHYIFVTKLEELYPNVTNWQMECADRNNRRSLLKFTYSLIPGITSFKKYGLDVASISWPKEIVDAAEKLYDQLDPPKERAKVEGLHILERLKYNLEAQLKMLKSKRQLTSDVLEDAMAVYARNLEEVGVDVMDYMPNGSLPDNHDPNITFQANKSEELSPILPEAVYSPAPTNVDDPEEDYQRFCQELHARNLETEYPYVFEQQQHESENDAALSSMISQKVDRIIENQNRCNSVSGLFKDPNSSIVWRSNILSNIESISREQTSFDFEPLGRSKLNEDDPDVTDALKDLQEYSSYLTQDWEQLDQNPEESKEIADDDGKTAPKSNVIIQTVHIFGKNDELMGVQRFDSETGGLIEENHQENCSENREDRTNNSNLGGLDCDSISVTDATFLTPVEGIDENFEENLDANSDRSFTMNFVSPTTSGQTKLIDNRKRLKPGSNSDHSFRIDFQNKPSKIDCQKSFFESTGDKNILPDLTNQNTILTSNSNNSFYSLRANTEDDIKRFSSKSSYRSHDDHQETLPKPISRISQEDSLYEILDEMQRSKSADNNREANHSPFGNCIKSTNRKENFGRKTFANTFYDILARNDVKRIIESKETASKSSFERTRSSGLVKASCRISKDNNLEPAKDNLEKVVEDAEIEHINKNIRDETREKTFDSSCSTLKLYHNRSLNASAVSRNERIKNVDNLFKITIKSEKFNSKVSQKDVFNTSGMSQTREFENFGQNNRSLLKITNENEKTSPRESHRDDISFYGVSQSKRLEISDQSKSSLLEITGESDKLSFRQSYKDVFNISGMIENKRVENVNQSNSNFPKIAGENEEIKPRMLYKEVSENTSRICQNNRLEIPDRSKCSLLEITNENEEISPRMLYKDVANTSRIDQNRKFENPNQSISNLLEITNENEKISYTNILNISRVNQTKKFENLDESKSRLLEIADENEEINTKMLDKNVSNTSRISQNKRLENVNQSKSNLLEITNGNEKINRKVLYKDALRISGKSKSNRFENMNGSNSNLLRITKENEEMSQKVLYKDIFDTSGMSQPKRHRSNSVKITDENEKASLKVPYRDIFTNSGANQTSVKNFDKVTDDGEIKSLKIVHNDFFNVPVINQTKTYENFNQITNKDEKMGSRMLCENILEENRDKAAFGETEQNFYSRNDIEIKKSSPSLISGQEQKRSDDLNNTFAMNAVEPSQSLNESRFQILPKSLKRYFEPVGNEEISDNRPTTNDNSLNRTFSISSKSLEAKSRPKNIFETSNGSESLFSSQDAFFSALDTSISKPKTPEKPVAKKKISKRKFVPPLKTNQSKPQTSQVPKKRIKKPCRQTSFVPPKKLSRKEILDDYERQRKQILEKANDPEQIDEYIKFINNRPNVQQIQKQKYLAVIKRTSGGVEVLRAASPVTKTKKVIPLERKLSENEFHKMLSDGNEGKLKSLLQTEEKMFDFDDTKTNSEFLKENAPIKSLGSEYSAASSSNIFDINRNVIDDIIKKYLDD